MDDKAKRGKPDLDRINVNEPYELRHWAEHFKVSTEKLRDAVVKVGPMAANVARHLGKPL